jgi:hypothetical protein
MMENNIVTIPREQQLANIIESKVRLYREMFPNGQAPNCLTINDDDVPFLNCEPTSNGALLYVTNGGYALEVSSGKYQTTGVCYRAVILEYKLTKEELKKLEDEATGFYAKHRLQYREKIKMSPNEVREEGRTRNDYSYEQVVSGKLASSGGKRGAKKKVTPYRGKEVK